MAKKIGVIAAVAFVLGTQGVTAASISETRLQELMASTEMQDVTLETLRARDRQILEELARSLAGRYSDVLAGSEMVFTRLTQSGSLYYRLDFVGLQNKDRARALCEILEMERCIAQLGNDRLTVLDVQADPVVSALTVIEADEDTQPFDWFAQEPAPEANPKSRDIEARVRDMLDPLGVYPEARPDFSDLVTKQEPAEGQGDTAPAQDEEAPVAAEEETPDTAAAEPVQAAPAPAPIAAPEQEQQESSLVPLLRPMEKIAASMAPPVVPMLRPTDRIVAELAAQDAKKFEKLYPIARPFGEKIAVYPSDVPALTKVAQAPSGLSRPVAFEKGPSLLSGAGNGVVEMADAGPMIAPEEAAPTVRSPIVSIPGLGEVDMSKIGGVPVIETARNVFADAPIAKLRSSTSLAAPQSPSVQKIVARMAPPVPAAPAAISASEDTSIGLAFEGRPMKRDIALASLPQAAPEPFLVADVIPEKAFDGRPMLRSAALSDLAQRSDAPAPMFLAQIEEEPLAGRPLMRAAVLADLAERQHAEAVRVAELAGQAAPKPMVRTVALLDIAPKPQVMTSVAALETPSIEPSADIQLAMMSAPPTRASVLPAPAVVSENVDIAMAAPSNPEPPVMMMAQAEPEVAPVDVPRRLVIEMPKEVAQAAPAPEAVKLAQAPTKPLPKPSLSKEQARVLADIAMVKASPEPMQLGRVSFDDLYARPAEVDFSDGHAAGKLQKLPFKRPDLSGYVRTASVRSKPLHEAGVGSETAMLSSIDQPFEIAQVPGSMMPPETEEVLPETAPFELKEPAASKPAPSALDQILQGGEARPTAAAPKPAAPILAAPTPATPKQAPSLDEILGKARTATTDTNAAASTPAAQNSRPRLPGEASVQDAPANPVTLPARPQVSPAVKSEAKSEVTSAAPVLTLTPQMRVDEDAPVKPTVAAPKVAPQLLPTRQVPAPTAKAPTTPAPVAQPEMAKTFEAPKATEEAYEARQVEDAAATQRRALEALSQIVSERQRTQQEAVQTEEAPSQVRSENGYFRPSGSQRLADPRGPVNGNSDLNAAQEVANYEASFSDDRTRMERASNPRGAVSPAETMQRQNSLGQPRQIAPADLRIELSYVGSREEVSQRVAELRSFFPPVMLGKGRFFGASVPEQPHRFVVGFAAEDMASRDDWIWYLEQMGIPWAIR